MKHDAQVGSWDMAPIESRTEGWRIEGKGGKLLERSIHHLSPSLNLIQDAVPMQLPKFHLRPRTHSPPPAPWGQNCPCANHSAGLAHSAAH